MNEIAPNFPVGIIHRSFHEVYLNDQLIKLLGITQEMFATNTQVEWDLGHFFEGGWLALVPYISPFLLNPTKYTKGFETMIQLIQKNGITTVGDTGFPNALFDTEFDLLSKEMQKNPPFEFYIIPSGASIYSSQGSNEEAKKFIEMLSGTYNTENLRFLPKQVKLMGDGAIYSQLMQMIDNYTDGHHGEWITPLDLLQEQISLYWDSDYKIHLHSNGDLGIQKVLDFLKEDQKRRPRINHRFTLHHMGYFTDVQAQEVADMGVEASVNPYYLWALADKYSTHGLGKEIAENLVRIKSLTARNVPVSFHSDYPMAPMEPLTLAWTTVNRITSENSKFSQVRYST